MKFKYFKFIFEYSDIPEVKRLLKNFKNYCVIKFSNQFVIQTNLLMKLVQNLKNLLEIHT